MYEQSYEGFLWMSVTIDLPGKLFSQIFVGPLFVLLVLLLIFLRNLCILKEISYAVGIYISVSKEVIVVAHSRLNPFNLLGRVQASVT